ncbi:TPA: lantibiotic dehydratase [Enterococcus faecalis]|nr:lantibiotic dehydratase [Enterococcus faecalis]HBI1770653.1 lantibiotic dehydratase [Enterococcus faecalis]HBI1794100.1 lantibiotic dehydratase [Enterococcus faecalis]HBI1800800.1 lantibiotic dehydratase [Enterococcus faecalis]HBI1803551.1 lantibiotic dehydratase [Enterococcus faecalis]
MRKLLIASNKFMIRLPFQDEKFKCNAIDVQDKLEELKQNPIFCEQLIVASHSLYELFKNSKFDELSSKKKRNLIASMVSYINRSATRTTPFGLFSGVGLADTTNNQLSNLNKEKTKFIKHARIDLEWLINFVKYIEKNYYLNLNFQFNSSLYIVGDRVFLPYNTDSKTDKISINLNRPFEMIYRKFRQADFFSFETLIGYLQAEYPERDTKVLQSFLNTLIEKEFLISSLRPPLTNVDELDWVISKMNDIPDTQIYKNLLVEIQNDISAYRKTEIGDGITLYESILSKMKSIKEIKSKSYLQVDCEIKTNSLVLIKEDMNQLEDFASFLLEISKYQKNKYLDEFKLRFLERYGEYIEVPIYELLDETLGIGAPMNYSQPQNRYITPFENLTEKSDLTEYFMDKYIQSIKMNTSITFNFKEISSYVEQKKNKIVPKNLELNFIVKEFENKKKFYLGPNIGSNKAGKTFGRFAYFSNQFLEVITEFDHQFSELSKEEICELVYLPKNIRSGNVTRDSTSTRKNISLHTSSYDKENEIKMTDILVGVENDRLYLRNLADNKKILVTSNNMLNPTIADNGIRLLQEISLQDELSWSNFPWSEVYSQFSYVPQIEYKNIVIETELWKINKYVLELPNDKPTKEQFVSNFKEIQTKLQIPNVFYLQSADNRILVDITKQVYIDLIYKKYNQFGEIIIRGIEAGESLNSICDGEKSVEVVIPFFRASKDSEETNENTRINNKLHADNNFAPFENWIFYKIYCSNENQEEVITFVNYFIEELSTEASIDISYFMRYSDPLPHIRLRIKADKQYLFEIAERFNRFISPLQHSKLVSKYIIATYYPENERYGGQELMPLAEHLFQIDSQVVVKLMANDQQKEKIGVVSVLHYLNSFGIAFENQIKLLEASVGKENFSVEFKDIKNEYISSIDSYNNWYSFKKDKKNQELIELMAQRENAIQEYAKALSDSNDLTNYLEDIILSVIHLHCNRLFGTDREFERKVYFFALHTLKGQSYKRKMMIENETSD